MFGSRVNLDETEQLIKEEFKNIDCVCTGFDDYMYIFTIIIVNKQLIYYIKFIIIF